MTEWWSYTLSDFLLFTPRTYYRLLERHNETVWPAQVLTLGVGLVVLGLLLRVRPWQGRVVSFVLALLWGWVAWAFLWKRYATINWAAMYFVPALAVEAVLLVWIGVVRRRLSFRLTRDPVGRLGMALLTLGLLVYPTLAPMVGRGWRQAEIFGIMPDPTAIATLGMLLLAQGRSRWELLAIPALWCMISGATLQAMGSPEAWVPPLAALLVLVASVWKHTRSGETTVANAGNFVR